MSVCAFSADSRQRVKRHTECVTACMDRQQERWVCILISGQAERVWPGSETKQYPLLDYTEIAWWWWWPSERT